MKNTGKIIFAFISGLVVGAGATYAFFEYACKKECEKKIDEAAKKAYKDTADEVAPKIAEKANEYYFNIVNEKLKAIGEREEEAKEHDRQSQEAFDAWRGRIERLEAREAKCREILGDEYEEPTDDPTIIFADEDEDHLDYEDQMCLERSMNGGLTNEEYNRVLELGTTEELLSEDEFDNKIYPAYDYYELDYLSDKVWFDFKNHESVDPDQPYYEWLQGKERYFHGGDLRDIHIVDHKYNVCLHLLWNDKSYTDLIEEGLVM